MDHPIRWGVLGAGKFAFEQMAPAIHMARGATLHALATSAPQKADRFKAFAPAMKVHDSYQALLDDPMIDAVYVPLPNHMHVEWTANALRAGKHVLTEKPIALAAGEIDDLIALRDETGLHAAEAYMIVHHPQWQKVREMLAEGKIGELRHVEGIFGYNNEADTGNIRNSPAKGGGGIPDIGVYTMGSTRWVTGQEPKEITHADVTFENGVDTIARVSARFETFSAHWLTTMRMHAVQEMRFLGSSGHIRVTAPFNPFMYGEAQIELTRAGKPVDVLRFGTDNHYVHQVEAFGETVRTGAAYAWPLEQSLKMQEMLDSVFAAVDRD